MTGRRAILVLGPESSGTRLVTSILMVGGCLGSSGHDQWWDDHGFEDGDDLIVWRRSFPHGDAQRAEPRRWPDVAVMAARLKRAGYAVQAVVVVREHYALTRSQMANGYAADRAEAAAQVAEAYARIFGGLAANGIPLVVVSYEGLVLRPDGVQAWLARDLALPSVPHVRIEDGDEKYYGDA